MPIKNLESLPLVDLKPHLPSGGGAFCCGDDDIDSWVRKKCQKTHEKYRARVQSAYSRETDEMVGFFCLSLKQEDETLLLSAQKPVVRAIERKFITLRLEILAVKKQFQRQGYGTRLLASSIGEFRRLIDTVGAIAMTLECSENVDPAFYENLGFERYGKASQTPKMLLPWMSVLDAYSDDS